MLLENGANRFGPCSVATNCQFVKNILSVKHNKAKNNKMRYACNIYITGIPGGEEREKGGEEIFKVLMTENFLKLIKDNKPQIQEAHRTPSRIYINNFASSHIIFKLQKTKASKKILKKSRRKKSHLANS